MSVLSDPTAGDSAGVTITQYAGDELGGNGDAGFATLEVLDTGQEAMAADTVVAPQPPPTAVPVRTRPVSGRYQATRSGWTLELRVDVDGQRTMRRVSGDFFSSSGATTSYYGSFVVDAPSVTVTATHVRIEGTGRFTWSTAARLIRITIPRTPIVAPAQAPATLQFFTPPSTPGATYQCTFASRYFRTVQWEQDSVAATVPFVKYHTGSLPQPPSSPARELTVSKAFAEAGIELLAAGQPNVIPGGTAGAAWSDSELHNAMVNHFKLFANIPQWRVWLLVATAHDQGYRGIMFDASGTFQRQGCAVFYDAIKGNAADAQRAALRTYVHELGHAFNLLHSWQKHFATPAAPLGPNGGFGDLSWMNYAQNYQPPPPAPGGTAAYWASFGFEFTDNELIHLRHGFYKNVIMGGSAFLTGAAEVDPEDFAAPVIDNSGLALELRSKGAFAYGEPVVVELKLSLTDLRGRTTHGYLHPKDDHVVLAIRGPSGRTTAFRPVLRHCVDEERTVTLDADRPAIYESAYVGYGRDGFYFDQPGLYELRAEYLASDGSRVVSPVARLRVRAPLSREDEAVGELLLGSDQGQLLSLLGSDSAALQEGNDALDTLLERYAEHPLAVYARLAKGINARRDFKDIVTEKRVNVRDADPATAIELLTAVEQASVADDEGVDNITLNLAMRQHALAEARAGNPERAGQVLDRMVETFEDKQLNPHVLETIRTQAAETRERIDSDA